MIKSAKVLRVAVLGTVLSSLFVVGAAAASVGVGTTTDALKVRESADTSATTLATAPKGDNVIVLEDVVNGWYKVDYQGVQGYMSADYLTVQTTADAKIGYGKVSAEGSTLNMREAASTDAVKVATLPADAVVDIIGVDNGWYKVSYGDKTGYVSSDYMIAVKDAAGSRGADTATASSSDLGGQIAAFGQTLLGKKYVYGGNGPNSFDCSGFTSYVYAHFGYTLNRSASDQYNYNGTKVTGDLQPGDLVFFTGTFSSSKYITHTGMYIGNGQFIHASTREYKVRIDNLFTGYYAGKYVGARRVI